MALSVASARVGLRRFTSNPVRLHVRPRVSSIRLQRRTITRAMQNPNPEQLKAMQAAYEEAMKDPVKAAKLREMEEQMKDPAYQKQMMQMQQMMSNQGLQQKMAELKDDPEFAEAFAEAEKKGMAGVMQLMNDKAFVARLGEKLGGPEAIQNAAATPQPQAPAEPEIETLMDAAKYGDLEALEDFIAIGKDVNEADKENRTPLHCATAYCHPSIISTLVEAGANLEAVDSKNNTPLHYAAGYGRVNECKLLINLGANINAQNETGKTPLDLARLNEQNPVNDDEECLAKLSGEF